MLYSNCLQFLKIRKMYFNQNTKSVFDMLWTKFRFTWILTLNPQTFAMIAPLPRRAGKTAQSIVWRFFRSLLLNFLSFWWNVLIKLGFIIECICWALFLIIIKKIIFLIKVILHNILSIIFLQFFLYRLLLISSTCHL